MFSEWRATGTFTERVFSGEIQVHSWLDLEIAVCACSGTELCLTLCDPMDCCPPGASGHGILQAFAWSGLPFLPPGDLPDPGIKPHLVCLLHWQVDSLPLSHLGSPEIAVVCCKMRYFSQVLLPVLPKGQSSSRGGPLKWWRPWSLPRAWDVSAFSVACAFDCFAELNDTVPYLFLALPYLHFRITSHQIERKWDESI